MRFFEKLKVLGRKGMSRTLFNASALGRKGMSTEVLAIILMVAGLAVISLLFIYLATSGKLLLGNTSRLGVNWTW